MTDPVVKARVDRLLRGDRRPEDISTIFMELRRKSYGNSAFMEIGDFIAHRGEKDKGPVSSDLRDCYVAARCQVLLSETTSLDMPAGTLDALAANLRWLDDSTLRAATRERRKTAEKIFRSCCAKIGTRVSGRMYQIAPFTAREARVFEALAKTTLVRPVFTHDRLFTEFGDVLTKNGYITSPDLPKLDPAKAIVGLFALVTMHRAVVVFAPGDVCHLRVAPWEDQGKPGPLAVAAESKLGGPHLGYGVINLRFAMFSTALDPKDFCEEDVLNAPPPWDFPIEITAGEKLARI